MRSAIIVGYRQAWLEGAAENGIGPNELTETERAALRDAINEDFQHILGFLTAIEGAPHENERRELTQLYSRGEMWVNRYGAVKAKAQLMAGADQKYRWTVGRTEHCEDCAMYDGRIYRGSMWAKYGIQPRSWRLACKGRRCQCQFVKTSDPCTPGRPPSPRGG